MPNLDPDQLKTVKANIEKYTEHQLKDTRAARYHQNTVGKSVRALLRFIDYGPMRNMPITWQSVKIAQDVWGTSRPYLQGKSVRKRNKVAEVSS